MYILEDYEDAFIGFFEKEKKMFIAVYDRKKCIRLVMKNEKLKYDDAVEYFEEYVEEHLTIDGAPIILNQINYNGYLELAEFLKFERQIFNPNSLH